MSQERYLYVIKINKKIIYIKNSLFYIYFILYKSVDSRRQHSDNIG